VLELFARLNGEGRTVVIVTHERDVRDFATREIAMADGQVRA
jgi:putative ABC transport system ATP-binding protein